MSDPCQCVWDHESAMRRLIAWLRENQSNCTDGECLSDGPNSIASGNLLLWSFMWGMLALTLFYMRPNSMRSQPPGSNGPEKPGGSNDNDSNEPPPPGIH